MNPSLLVVRPDHGDGVGAGHLGRCLALAQAWLAAGGRAAVAVDGAAGWASRYERAGVAAVPVAGVAPLAPAWVVLDGYRFGPDSVVAARDAGALVAVIDDHGTGGLGGADVVLDQNLGAEDAPHRYEVADGGTRLLGCTYALVRTDVAGARLANPPPVPARAARLVVSAGGASSPAVKARFDATLAGLAPNLEPVWLAGVDEVGPVLAGADVALAAAGSTSWDLCCLGIPAVLVSVAGNQRPIVAALHRAGAAVDAGDLAGVDPAALAATVRALGDDEVRRQAMADTGRRLVDGRGARRVVEHLLGRLADR